MDLKQYFWFGGISVQTLTDGMGSSCIFISVPLLVSCKALNLPLPPCLLYDLFTGLPFSLSFPRPCPGLILYSAASRAQTNYFLLFSDSLVSSFTAQLYRIIVYGHREKNKGSEGEEKGDMCGTVRRAA